MVEIGGGFMACRHHMTVVMGVSHSGLWRPLIASWDATTEQKWRKRRRETLMGAVVAVTQ